MLTTLTGWSAMATFAGQALPAVTPPPKAPETQSRLVINCTMSGANFGRRNQVCTAQSDEIELLNANPGEPKRSYSDVDGSYVEQYVYRIPRPQTFELKYCAPDIIAVRANSLSMTPVISKKISAPAGCIDLQIFSFSGLLSVAVRSQTADSRLNFSVVIPPFIPPPPPMVVPPIILPPPPMPM